jgi:tRNA pseudouridine55 synthase
MEPGDLVSWRCGRRLAGPTHLSEDQVVVILNPDGNQAGMARAVSDGWLQPRLVLEATG